jgi:restriction system protein
MWEKSINHDGLHKYRVVKGQTQDEVELKASLQLRIWNEQWERVRSIRQREHEKTVLAIGKEKRRQLAEEQNAEAERQLAAMDTLLRDGASGDHRVKWEKLKHALRYSVPEPRQPQFPHVPPEPVRGIPEPKLSFLAKLIPSIRAKQEALAKETADERFRTEHEMWMQNTREAEKRSKELREQHAASVAEYKAAEQTHIERERQHNQSIDQKQEAYLRKDPEAVVEYCEMVLDASSYPESFPSNFEVDYIPETRILLVDYALPPIDALPSVKGYKYVATKDVVQPISVSDAWLNKTYDLILYQITLRTMYEILQADEADAIDAVVFNGWVNAVDKATGKEVNGCIVTVQANKAEVLDINMEQVEPKACFKKLKGVSAAKLIALSPVRPILQLNKNDKRFVPAHNVVDTLDNTANLASMDWEDFEHLIRELFEKEFSKDGGEVKITQASRDGGVDAIAFDEDPIRGGKIIIQAKRYTNTVSVSAVRDLYGTIMNEGANKGILVTTADYGPDAYEFAKGKPITLLSGNELLFLLQKHGHKARINLAEARMVAQEKSKTASGN